MKVLIVSENDKTISGLKSFLKTRDGYEIITYRTPIKAMDNFGEIAPSLIVLSAVDFPKHWKIFMQYVNIVHLPICDTVLIVDKKFDEAEKEKASVLGVWKTLSESKLHQFVAETSPGTMKFTDILNEETDTIPAPEPEIPLDPMMEDPMPDAAPEPEIPLDPMISESGQMPEEEPAVDTSEATRLDEQFEEAFQEQEMLLERERDSLLTSIAPTVEPYASHPVDESYAPAEPDFTEPDIPTDPPEEDFAEPEMTADEMAKLAESLAPPKADPREVQFLFRHPVTAALVTGIVETAADASIVFRPDLPEVPGSFDSGDLITSATYKNGESVALVDAYVMPWDDTLHFTLVRNEET
jgi:hypothetical protein